MTKKLLVTISDDLMKKIKLKVDLENTTIKDSITRTLEAEYGSMSTRDRDNLEKLWGKKK